MKTDASCEPHAAVVVLNWNWWRDTLTCLSSLLSIGYPRFQVLVCDNGSTDESLVEIAHWAAGARRTDGAGEAGRPLRWMQLDRDSLERGRVDATSFGAAELVLIANGANLGFAAGNNVGLRAALELSTAEYFWLLNNDTTVDHRALSELVARMMLVPGCGLCGSALVNHHAPDKLQAVAGVYNRWLAQTRQLAFGAEASVIFDDDEMTHAADFVIGASMLLSRALLRDIGLLSEDYFLYFEEIDLITRARTRFGLACATRSRVTHKWGASINPLEAGRSSAVADYYFTRSRLMFTVRYYPYALPTVLAAIAGTVLGRLAQGRWSSAHTMLIGFWDGLLGKRGARIVRGRRWPG